MALPTLAQIVGAMMGGGGDISQSLKAITELAQKLIEDGFRSPKPEDERNKELYDAQLQHPMFQVHRGTDFAQYAKDTKGMSS